MRMSLGSTSASVRNDSKVMHSTSHDGSVLSVWNRMEDHEPPGSPFMSSVPFLWLMHLSYTRMRGSSMGFSATLATSSDRAIMSGSTAMTRGATVE